MKSQRLSDFPKVHIITISLRKAVLRYMFRFTNGEGVKFVALDYTNVFNTNINTKLVILQDVWTFSFLGFGRSLANFYSLIRHPIRYS